MRILHTSDWHLGQLLMDKSREEEMDCFLSFLKKTIEERGVDILIVSGDIFDSGSPSNSARRQYFSFLASLKGTCCTDVVIIAGNHDSPSDITAPEDILSHLGIHTYASVENLCPLVIPDKAVILPVPFPRDQELRRYISNESFESEEIRYRQSIIKIYNDMACQAVKLNAGLPIIATGHLMVSEAGGEEKAYLYIGGLGAVSVTDFPDVIGYTALGHIHKPQSLNSMGTICYSGSPIPMTFREAKYRKVLKLADFSGNCVSVSDIEIPVFRNLYSFSGTEAELLAKVRSLADSGQRGWISLELTDCSARSTIRQNAEALTEGMSLEILQVKDVTIASEIAGNEELYESLEQLTESDVFGKLLDENNITGQIRDDLFRCYEEILYKIRNSEE